MYNFLDTSTPNSGLGTKLRDGGGIINANFLKLHAWMQSRANIAANSIPTLASGGPAYLLAVEFAPGDPMPLTVYERTTAPVDTANPAWVPSTDGQWWKLVPQGGVIYIEQFGGKADSNIGGIVGRDNLGPLYKAFGLRAWEINPDAPRSYEVRFSAGHYRFSDTIEVHTCVPIRGIGGGFEGGGATYWHFPANKTFVIFGSNATSGETTFGLTNQGESAGSSIEHITMRGSASSTDHARAGIHIRTIVALRHVHLMGVTGDAFRVKGSTSAGTIADFVTLEHCSVNGQTRDALYIDGNDANVCHVSHFSVHGGLFQGGCGINDAAVFGNKYDNIHIAGYGNQGVYHLGRSYFLITYGGEKMPTPGPGPGELTTPGTNDEVWYDNGPLASASVQFPQWTSAPAVPYRPQIPVLTNGAGHVFDNLYVEGSTPCHLPGGTMAFGGTFEATKYSNKVYGDASGLRSYQGFGIRQVWQPGQSGYTYNGAESFVDIGPMLHPSYERDKGQCILQHARASDSIGGSTNYMLRYYDKDIEWRRPNSKYVLQITTPSTAKTFGRSTPQSDFLVLPDVGLIDPGNSNVARIFGIRYLAPPDGYHAQGEFFFNQVVLPGYYPLGWSCTASGNPATWSALHLPAEVTTTYNPPSLAAGAVSSIGTAVILGAQMNDFAEGSFSRDLQGIRINAWVGTPDIVSYQMHNPTAGTIDLASGTLQLRLKKSSLYAAPAPPAGFWKQPITRVGLNLIDGADYPHVNYGYPSASLLNWVKSIGVNHVRLTFRIEALEPTIGATLDSAQLTALVTSLNAAQAAGVMCNLSAHNFGRNNNFTGERRYGVEGPGSALATFWGKMATAVKDHPALMAYGLMNEPPWEVTAWKDICQDCITAIRAVDARTPIVAPIRGAVAWNIGEGYNDDMATLTGDYVAIEAHQYPDWDSAGTFDTHSPDEHYARPASYGVAVNDWQANITAAYRTWLTTHNRVGYLGETGMPSLCWFFSGGWSEHWDARTSTGIAFWRDMHEVAIGVMGDAGIPTMFWCSGDHAEANKLFVGSHVVPTGQTNLYVEMITRSLAGKPLISGPAPA